jgi:hypothetical protein
VEFWVKNVIFRNFWNLLAEVKCYGICEVEHATSWNLRIENAIFESFELKNVTFENFWN